MNEKNFKNIILFVGNIYDINSLLYNSDKHYEIRWINTILNEKF